MTDKIRNLLEDVQTVYEGKGMIVHPSSFDRLRVEVIKLDNINKQQSEQLTEAKEIIKTFLGFAEAFGYSPSMDKFISEAEQFSKETE